MPDVGRKAEGTHVQSLVFPKDAWTEADVRRWLKEHDFFADGIDETEGSWRARQYDPDSRRFNYRTMQQHSGGRPFSIIIGFEKAYRLSIAGDGEKRTVKLAELPQDLSGEVIRRVSTRLDDETWQLLRALALSAAAADKSSPPDITALAEAAAAGITDDYVAGLNDEALDALWAALEAAPRDGWEPSDAFREAGCRVYTELENRGRAPENSELAEKLERCWWFHSPRRRPRKKAMLIKAKVAKARDDQQVIYCIAIDADAEDTEGDYIAKADIPRIAHQYMLTTGGRSVTLNHEQAVNCVVVESWIAKADGTLGKEPYKEGDWLVGIHVPDPVLWAAVKEYGTGVSIGGVALMDEDEGD